MQMKAILIAAAMAFAAVPGAFAGSKDNVHRGFPGFCNGGATMGECMFAGRFDDGPIDRFSIISCNEARQILARRGYTKIKTVSCKSTTYVFNARWKGKSYELRVARRDGSLLTARKI
jgi:hypothetical protein